MELLSTRRASRLLAGLAALALASACADDGGTAVVNGSPTPSAAPTVTATPTPPAPTPKETPAPLPQPVQAAIEQAAADAGIAPDAVELVRYRSEEWDDTSLGCPEAGKFYAQVVTPGYVVQVRVGEQEREYHTDLGTRVVSCNGAED